MKWRFFTNSRVVSSLPTTTRDRKHREKTLWSVYRCAVYLCTGRSNMKSLRMAFFTQNSWLVKWRVESRRRSGFSLPVAVDCTFAPSPQSGLAWLCFLFPLVEPDRQISRIRLSEKTHDVPCDAVGNF